MFFHQPFRLRLTTLRLAKQGFQRPGPLGCSSGFQANTWDSDSFLLPLNRSSALSELNNIFTWISNIEALAGWSSKCFCPAYVGWHPKSCKLHLRDVCLTYWRVDISGGLRSENKNQGPWPFNKLFRTCSTRARKIGQTFRDVRRVNVPWGSMKDVTSQQHAANSKAPQLKEVLQALPLSPCGLLSRVQKIPQIRTIFFQNPFHRSDPFQKKS